MDSDRLPEVFSKNPFDKDTKQDHSEEDYKVDRGKAESQV
jgi:hypothetical protein